MSDKRLRMNDDLCQFVVKWDWLGVQCRNVLYAVHRTVVVHVEGADPTPWTDSDATDFASQLCATLGTELGPFLSTECTLTGCDWCWNVATPTGPLHTGSNSTGSPLDGTNAADSLQTFAALAVHLGTGLAGRANNGRMYMPGLNEGLITPPNFNRLRPSSFADLNTVFSAIQAALSPAGSEDLAGDGYNGYLAVASFFVPGSFAGSGVGTLRDVAVANRVSEMLLKDDIIDTMRSRKLGHGI